MDLLYYFKKKNILNFNNFTVRTFQGNEANRLVLDFLIFSPFVDDRMVRVAVTRFTDDQCSFFFVSSEYDKLIKMRGKIQNINHDLRYDYLLAHFGLAFLFLRYCKNLFRTIGSILAISKTEYSDPYFDRLIFVHTVDHPFFILLQPQYRKRFNYIVRSVILSAITFRFTTSVFDNRFFFFHI